MNSWFTVKVKYTKQLEDGRLKRVTEPYLLDAVSFTDAEARIYEELGSQITGEFIITNIAKTDYADIFYYEDADDWYKCKLNYISIDADSGKEKKVSNNFLVTAGSVKEAYDRIKESLSEMTVTFEISSIMLSPIVEVMPYNPDLDVELERRPIEETQANSDELNEDEEDKELEEEQDQESAVSLEEESSTFEDLSEEEDEI
jgi:uncharacterized membrane protein